MKEHLRTVKSYVRRQGRITKKQTQALEKLGSKYGIEFQETVINFDKIFACEAPTIPTAFQVEMRRKCSREAECTNMYMSTETSLQQNRSLKGEGYILEIGFGMGQALLAMAQQNPQQNFIGIEVHRPGVGNLLSELEAQQINNVRVFCADAVEVLRYCIPDHFLSGINIFFPDPWPKKRHHKRRLIQTDFVLLLQQKLKSQGFLHLATDWQHYAEHMMAVLNTVPGFINAAGEGNFMPRPENRPLTKFEQRGQQLGHEVWDLVFYRC
jgi:tRNA (guanine-N7-)-methyltransferase